MEASLNELVLKRPQNYEEKELESVKGFDKHLEKFVKIECKKINKTNEFKVVLEKSQQSNQLDIKVIVEQLVSL